MADERTAEAIDGGSGKAPISRKNVIFGSLLLVIMILEGAVVVVLVKNFGPQPAQVAAEGINGLDPQEGQGAPEEVEVEVVTFRAQNEKLRQVVMYDMTVFASVLEEDASAFKQLVSDRQATIKDRFSSVIRSSDPEVLAEPDPVTLRGQFRQELGSIVGDPEMVRQILIPSIIPYRAN
jgi:hypothetical protein